MLAPIGPAVPLDLTLPQQILIVVTAYGIKPAYMTLTLAYLWVRRKDRHPELVIAWRGMAAFLVGEIVCAANFLLFNDASRALELTHDLGMVLTFALLARAMHRAFEDRILRASDPTRNCALLATCRQCVKREPVGCLASTGQAWLTGALALCVLLPLTIPLRGVRYETRVLGHPVVLHHSLEEQVWEARVLPLFALALLSAASLAARSTTVAGRHRASLLLAAGLGPAGFAWLRTVVAFPFLDRIYWMGFWEEASELVLVILTIRLVGEWASRLTHDRVPESGTP